MKISFHGAAGCVTGSKHIIHLKDGRKVLLDCGMFQGMGKDTDTLNRDWGFDPATITVMVLSHAHIDHSGLIPKLTKDGYTGSIFCTPATKDLATILLEDSAVIQRDDAKYGNKRRLAQRLPLLEPLYTEDDAKHAIGQFTTIDYKTWHEIIPGVSLHFTDAGHIVGSACVHIRVTEGAETRQITFSGDIGRYRDIILKSPEEFSQADFIIMESTYGNSLHEEGFTTPDHLLEWIEETCLKKKGKLIIPAFSVGRTQELLFALNQLELEKRLPNIPVFVDSPLSSEATHVMKSYPQYFNKTIQKIYEIDDDPFKFKGLTFVANASESKMLNYRREPCVIISSSGMADAGRVKHHISHNIENSRNTILIVGYCEPNSLGGKLSRGEKEVKIFGVEHQVNATIGKLKGMSAHGDYEDMCQWLQCQDAKAVHKLFLVHGEPEVQHDFKQKLIKKKFDQVIIPELHQEFQL